MYAGYGDGHDCAGCGDVIDKRQVEWEATYGDGQSYRLHLSCAGLWDVERRRRQPPERETDKAQQREHTQRLLEQAQAALKDSARLRDRADVLAREAVAVIEEARRVKRGEQPEK
jgi:hypothetical protein